MCNVIQSVVLLGPTGLAYIFARPLLYHRLLEIREEDPGGLGACPQEKINHQHGHKKILGVTLAKRVVTGPVTGK